MKCFRLPVAAFALCCAAAASADQASGAPAPNASVTPAFIGAIPNITGKSLKSVVVAYPPGGASPAHRHARSAFILAYVLEGEVTSAVNDGPPKVYKAGEYWTENPGDRHSVSQNASKTKPAKLLAIFVVDSDDEPLTSVDPGSR